MSDTNEQKATKAIHNINNAIVALQDTGKEEDRQLASVLNYVMILYSVGGIYILHLDMDRRMKNLLKAVMGETKEA